ncbi:hypothetical protein [Portibacter lacus]|uniref:Histidine kinase n=1 Tax=Portibacter lacus TaxID=1099794 RepID=A0AA37STN3_9BACT|nr:hypothetical protein [Portibacter lacus]GLR19090.1 histidine kinase [Portibacter lacus]
MEQPNMSYIQSMSGGDTAFEQKLLDIIKLEYPEERETYISNFTNREFKAAADNVHKLKHKISILGLEKSYGIASDFENNLLEGKTDLSIEFKSILDTITEYLQQI